MIDRSSFIRKKGRKYFKATCNKCGADRGYKTPDHADRLCVKCNCIKANETSVIARKKNKKKKTLFTTTKAPLRKTCKNCSIIFETKTKQQIYCTDKCNAKAYRLRNPLKVKETAKKYRNNNIKKIRELSKKWCLNNKDRLSAYRAKNKIAGNLRSRISRAVKRNLKGGSAIRDLGCSISDLKLHLESKWLPGMSWENYGLHGWHIDHIKPLDSFSLENRKEFLRACHYTNLQPLWAKDNLSKGAKCD